MRTLLITILLAIPALTFTQDYIASVDYTSKYNRVYMDSDDNARYTYTNYKNSINGPIKKYQNDKLVMEGWAIADKPHATWREFGPDGQKLAEIGYVLGKKNGVWKIWDKEGNLRYKFQYRHGKPVGKWFMYDATGKIVQTKTF